MFLKESKTRRDIVLRGGLLQSLSVGEIKKPFMHEGGEKIEKYYNPVNGVPLSSFKLQNQFPASVGFPC